MMTRLRRMKILAMAVPLGALLIVGASQTANFSKRMGQMELPADCAQPSKIFRFSLDEVDGAYVSALRVRFLPEATLAQLRFNPQPEEMLFNRDGTLELRYATRTLQAMAAAQLELCSATPMHEVREAYWVVREPGRVVAKLIEAARIDWQWRESGTQPVPGTQVVIKELSCTGQALVQPYQLITGEEPLCVKDPVVLAKLQKELQDLQREQASFIGRLRALLLGERAYEGRLLALNAQIEKLYLKAPYPGQVLGVTYDQRNGLAWIRIRVEEAADLRVSP